METGPEMENPPRATVLAECMPAPAAPPRCESVPLALPPPSCTSTPSVPPSPGHAATAAGFAPDAQLRSHAAANAHLHRGHPIRACHRPMSHHCPDVRTRGRFKYLTFPTRHRLGASRPRNVKVNFFPPSTQ